MLRCVPFTASMTVEWDDLATTRGAIFHTTAFRRILLETFAYRCAYHAVVDNDDRIRALLPLVVGRDLGLKQAGVSLPFVNYTDICAADGESGRFALNSLTGIKEKYHLNYIELRLKDTDPSPSGWRANCQHHTFSLPLTGDENEILALSSSSNRNHVRKAYKHNCFEVSFDPVNLDAFYRVYVKRMKQLGSPAPDSRFFRRFFEYLPNNASLLTVLDRTNGQVAGGMLLLTSPGDQTLYYPYGANLVEYNSKYLNSFMYWEAVRFGIRSGMKRLDLGRSQAGSGTYKYKEQWGARAEPLYYLVAGSGCENAGSPDRENLRVFVAIWKRMPSLLTDQIGKRLIKYVLP